MAVELATARISLSADTRPAANDIRAFFKDLDKQGSKAGKDLSASLSSELSKGSTRGADELGRKLNDSLSKSTKGSGKRAVDTFESEAEARGRRVGTAVGTVIGKGMGAAISVGIAGAATVATAAVGTLTLALTKGFQRLKTIDQAKFKLKALGSSAEEVASIMASAEKAVKGTAFSLGDAATVAASAVAAGKEPGEQLTKYLTLIADTAAVAGTEFSEMASIFNKVSTNNKAYTDDLQQLADRGIPVFQLLRKQYGVTAEELQKMVEDGKVTADDFQRALQGKLGGAAATIGGSFSSAVDNAEAALGRLGAALLKPAFDQASGQIGGVTAALDKMTAWVGNNQDVVIGFFGESAKAAITFAEAVALTAEWTTRSLGWIVNAFGDTYGSMLKIQSGINRMLGRTDIADQLLADAEAAYGAGDGLLSLADRAGDAQKPLQDLFWKIDEWKVGAQDAARETQLLKDGLGDLTKKAEVSSGTTIIKAPTAAELNAIDKAVFKVQQIPDTQDFVVIPQTDDAAEALIAFRDKEAEKPVEVPAEADTKPAEDGVGEWRTDEQGNPVQIPVAPQLDAANTAMEGFLAKWSQAVISPQIATGPGFTSSNGMPGSLAGLPGVSSNPNNIDTHGALTPETQAVQDYLRNGLGFKGDIGGYRQPDGFNEHSSGKASDVMIGSLAEGYALLPNLLRRPGVQYILFDNKQWNPDGTSSTGISSPHTDHLHVKTYATGGGVNGPGTATSDSIPAWLSNGEHVLTAEDVAALGGQGGVYDFRNALHRRTGGSIFKTGSSGSTGGYNQKGEAVGDVGQRIWEKIKTQNPSWGDDTHGLIPGENFRPQGPSTDLGVIAPWWMFPGDPHKGAWGTYGGVEPGTPEWNNRRDISIGPHPGGGRVKNPDVNVSPWMPAPEPGAAWFDPPNEQQLKRRLGFAEGGPVTPELIQQLAAAVNPANQHGTKDGAAPGPVDPAQQAADLGRTGGYIPAAAGNTDPVGEGGLSNFLDLGESFVHGLIDTGADVASMAASAAAAAGTGGAGAAAGPAASMGIKMGAEALKRGVSWGYDMAGIWGEALVEQVMPFGAPHWLGSTSPMAFMPQIPGQQPGQDPAAMEAARQKTMGAAANVNPGGTAPVEQPGADPSAGMQRGADAIKNAQKTPPPVTPPNAMDLFSLGIFDQGGMLAPNSAAINLSKQPEYVLTPQQWKAMQQGNADGGKSGGDTNQFYAQDVDAMFREYTKNRRRESRQYAGRP